MIFYIFTAFHAALTTFFFGTTTFFFGTTVYLLWKGFHVDIKIPNLDMPSIPKLWDSMDPLKNITNSVLFDSGTSDDIYELPLRIIETKIPEVSNSLIVWESPLESPLLFPTWILYGIVSLWICSGIYYFLAPKPVKSQRKSYCHIQSQTNMIEFQDQASQNDISILATKESQTVLESVHSISIQTESMDFMESSIQTETPLLMDATMETDMNMISMEHLDNEYTAVPKETLDAFTEAMKESYNFLCGPSLDELIPKDKPLITEPFWESPYVPALEPTPVKKSMPAVVATPSKIPTAQPSKIVKKTPSKLSAALFLEKENEQLKKRIKNLLQENQVLTQRLVFKKFHLEEGSVAK